MKIFKEFWSENGDYMSYQYAGTPSTSTNVTMNGNEGGLLAYIQKAIDIELGIFHPSSKSALQMKEMIDKRLELRFETF